MFFFTAVNLSFFKFVSWLLEVFYICSTPSLKTHTRFDINMALIFDEQGFTCLYQRAFLILVEAYLNTQWYNIKTDPTGAILREFVSKCLQYNLVFFIYRDSKTKCEDHLQPKPHYVRTSVSSYTGKKIVAAFPC